MMSVKSVTECPDRMQYVEKILIIDDDPLIREILAAMLARQGYSVESAADIDAARACVSRDVFDLVFLDIVFPEQKHSGFNIMHCIRERQPDCPVVLITAYPSTETAVEALHQNAFDYLMKPLKFNEIEAVADRALRYKVRRSEVLYSNMHINLEDVGGVYLSSRERDVLSLLVRGFSYRGIALHLGCKVSSIQTYTKRIYRKFGVHSRAEAVYKVLQRQIIQP